MLRFCVLEKYRLPAEKKHQEFLKSKKDEILSKVGEKHIKILRASGYSKIFLAGPNANLQSLQVTINETPVFSK